MTDWVGLLELFFWCGLIALTVAAACVILCWVIDNV